MDFNIHKQRVDEAIISYGWLEVLRELTPLTNAIDNFQPGQGKGGGALSKRHYEACPCCDGNSDKFHLQHDALTTGGGHCWRCNIGLDGYGIIMEFNGWDFSQAFKEIKRVIKFDPRDNSKPLPRKPTKPKVYEPTKRDLEISEFHKKKMQEVWEGTIAFNSEYAKPAHLYLKNRGLPYHGQNYNNQVRFHPALEYFISIPDASDRDKPEHVLFREQLTQYALNHPHYKSHSKHKSGLPKTVNMGKHPCIVMMLRDGKDGLPRRLHRIYLSNDGGKIAFDGNYELSAKMMMSGGIGSEIDNASVHLSAAGTPIIGLAEGFETAEAATAVTNMPMHITINASGIGGYYPTRGTKVIFIFEDKDRSKTGEKQSLKLIERLAAERPEVRVIRLVVPAEIPENQKSIDWLDIYNYYDDDAFPEIAKKWDMVLSDM